MLAPGALQFNFTPFPELTTGRLLLRKIVADDAPAVLEMRRKASQMQYIARPVAENIQDAYDLIGRVDTGLENNQSINWGITLKGSSELIGIVGFVRSTPEHHRAEVGYMLDTPYHRKGYMTEAVKAVLAYGFGTMKLHLAEAVIDPRNAASEGVLLKLGFVKEAHFRENTFFNGEYTDSAHYRLLARDFAGI